jgi:hypothetical protein
MSNEHDDVVSAVSQSVVSIGVNAEVGMVIGEMPAGVLIGAEFCGDPASTLALLLPASASESFVAIAPPQPAAISRTPAPQIRMF